MIKNEAAVVDKRRRWNEDWPEVAWKYYWRTYGRQRIIEEYLGWGKVLDVGCGMGFTAAACKPDSSYYTGMDISEEAIKMARELFGASEFHILDATKEPLPFNDNSFDTVLCSELVEHVEDYGFLLKEIRRVAKRDIVLTVPVDMGNPDHVWPKWAYDDIFEQFGWMGHIVEVRRLLVMNFCLVHILKKREPPERQRR